MTLFGRKPASPRLVCTAANAAVAMPCACCDPRALSAFSSSRRLLLGAAAGSAAFAATPAEARPAEASLRDAAGPMAAAAAGMLACAAMAGMVPADAPAPRVGPHLLRRVSAAVDADGDRLKDIFRDIHRNPELGFMERRTAAIVAEALRGLGFEVKTGIGVTGVVGILRNGPGPVVMYRADMDANAVEEATGLPYASRVRVKREDGVEVPVAHMCGHDAHVAWMLGVAKQMVALRDAWSGTLVLVGQPAEELILGAAAMVADGLYTRHGVPVPEMVIALHTTPGPTGMVGHRGGTIMAGTDQIDVTFFGEGGHGSTPHLTRDPVVMAVMAVAQYQTIVSRAIDPREMSVLTVGAFQAGADNNVIPETALLKLNLRFFEPAVRERMIAAIRSMSRGIAVSAGMPEAKMPAIAMKGGSPALVNDAALMGRLRQVLVPLLGAQNIVDDFPAASGSEDVHMLRGDRSDIPVAFTLVGIAKPAVYDAAIRAGRAAPFNNHGPFYDVDLDAIPIGAKVGTLELLEVLAT